MAIAHEPQGRLGEQLLPVQAGVGDDDLEGWLEERSALSESVRRRIELTKAIKMKVADYLTENDSIRVGRFVISTPPYRGDGRRV